MNNSEEQCKSCGGCRSFERIYRKGCRQFFETQSGFCAEQDQKIVQESDACGRFQPRGHETVRVRGADVNEAMEAAKALQGWLCKKTITF